MFPLVHPFLKVLNIMLAGSLLIMAMSVGIRPLVVLVRAPI